MDALEVAQKVEEIDRGLRAAYEQVVECKKMLERQNKILTVAYDTMIEVGKDETVDLKTRARMAAALVEMAKAR